MNTFNRIHAFGLYVKNFLERTLLGFKANRLKHVPIPPQECSFTSLYLSLELDD